MKTANTQFFYSKITIMGSSISKKIFILVCLFYSFTNAYAQEKSSYSKVLEKIIKHRKSGLEHGQETTDREGNSLRVYSTKYALGFEIENGLRWLKHGIFFSISGGRVTKTTTYDYGVKSGEYLEFHPNNELKLQVNYLHNVKDGVQYEYRDDGSLQYETDYLGDKRHGKRIEYLKDGTKKWETSYKDGKPHGMRLMYNDKGILKEKVNFIDGKKVGKTEYVNQ